jgi:hypothetical protein
LLGHASFVSSQSIAQTVRLNLSDFVSVVRRKLMGYFHPVHCCVSTQPSGIPENEALMRSTLTLTAFVLGSTYASHPCLPLLQPHRADVRCVLLSALLELSLPTAHAGWEAPFYAAYLSLRLTVNHPLEATYAGFGYPLYAFLFPNLGHIFQCPALMGFSLQSFFPRSRA